MAKTKGPNLGSLIKIEIPFLKFEKYVRYTDKAGLCRIRGSGELDDHREITSKPDLMVGLCNLGISIRKIYTEIGMTGIGKKVIEPVYALISQWIEKNGFPADPFFTTSTTDVDKDKENYSIMIDFNGVAHASNQSIDVNQFARQIWMFSDRLEYARDVKRGNNRIDNDFFSQVQQFYLKENKRICMPDWNNIKDNEVLYEVKQSDIEEHRTLIMPIVGIAAGIEEFGGIIPLPTYDTEKGIYRVVLRANTHLGAAYAQLSFSLLGDDIMECSECHTIYFKDSKRMVCSDVCEAARASGYVKNTSGKPPDARNQKFTPKGKRK